MKDSSTELITVPHIQARKGRTKISVLTAYDYTMARLIDGAGIDMILVGDSLGCVVQGHSTTLPVTLDHVIYHTECVARGTKRALLVSDLPFLSYQVSPAQAIESAGKLIKAGAAAVKLEGGVHMAETVAKLVAIDIPVMGHVGLTPQSFHRMGGNKVQGKKNGFGAGGREKIIEDALSLDNAGVFAIVVEGVPAELAAEITAAVSVPTIGIGAGPHCDGQVLVAQDMLGMVRDFSPRFVKKYQQLGALIEESVKAFVSDVKSSDFPAAEHYSTIGAVNGLNGSAKVQSITTGKLA